MEYPPTPRALPLTFPSVQSTDLLQEIAGEVLEALPGGLVRIAPDGRILVANKIAQQFLGLQLDELTQLYVVDFAGDTFFEDGSPCPPSEYPAVRCLSSGKSAGPVTIGVRQRDGQVRWASFTACPVRADGGVLVTFSEITERVEALRRLSESELRFRALVEGSFEGVVLTVDGLIVECNEVFAQTLCRSRTSLLGMPAAELATLGTRQRIVEHARSGATDAYLVESRRPDGSVVVGEIRGRNALYQGKPARVAALRDVTERERVFATLRKWEHIFDSVKWGAMTTAPDGLTIDLANPAAERLLGGPTGALRGRALPDLFFSDDRQDLEARLLRLTATGRHQFEARLAVSDQTVEPVWASVDVSDMRDPDGALLYRFLQLVDVTSRRKELLERRDFDDRIRHTQKLESLGVLAGGVAHDFNNLLVGVMGYADLATRYAPEGSALAEYLAMILRSAQQAAELTHQMLAYAGRARTEAGEIDLNKVVAEMLELLRVTVGRRTILSPDLAMGLSTINGDVSQIRQVVMNLVTNAAEALSEGGGQVTVSTRSTHLRPGQFADAYLGENLVDGEFIELCVADAGVGMSPDTRRRIFDPFFTTKFTGRGLGLAAVFGIVRSHRGLIHVESELGRGTRFKILFPASKTPSA